MRVLKLLIRMAAMPVAVVLLAALIATGAIMIAARTLFVSIAAAIEAITSV
jgi:hypothetical protein